MEIYLAGGISGNCKPLWTDLIKAERSGRMDLYLAGTNGRRWCVDLYLAGNAPWRKDGIYNNIIEKFPLSILESYYYADEWTEWIIPRVENFMLDSGAFTFMTSHKGNVDWSDYIRKYADFINKNDVKLFYELDIDSIVGYKKVLEMRKFLEAETGKQPIPVWHKSRGRDEFLKMCEEYPYVAIGGIVSKEITRKDYEFFPWFINEAHKRGAKIHGLGFTNLEGIRKYHFDSVDSTSWTTGNRFGSIYRFNGRTMEKYDKKAGQRLADSRAVAINNFNEWAKFQQYARTHL
jgi:hypothetical protein